MPDVKLSRAPIGSLEIVRGEMGGPDLGGHEYVVAADPRGAQALADALWLLESTRYAAVVVDCHDWTQRGLEAIRQMRKDVKRARALMGGRATP